MTVEFTEMLTKRRHLRVLERMLDWKEGLLDAGHENGYLYQECSALDKAIEDLTWMLEHQ